LHLHEWRRRLLAIAASIGAVVLEKAKETGIRAIITAVRTIISII
jgi:uroporphyrinogen-III synthase